ncbi:MAG: S-layer homology domain-containing protein [Acidimicrobiales bacterium]
MDRLAGAAIAVGSVDGSFSPAAPVSREQMATFLARLLDALVEAGHATPPA